MTRPSISVEAILAEAERFEAAGRLDAAIDLLTAANAGEPRFEIEKRLVDLRHRAFYKHAAASTEALWPPKVAPYPDGGAGIPEITPDALSVKLLRSAVFTRGALIVRSMLPSRDVEVLSDAVTSASQAGAAVMSGEAEADSAWFAPFRPLQGEFSVAARSFVMAGGNVLAADSPRALFQLLQIVKTHGLDRLVAGFMGERAALSVKKTTLRNVRPDLDTTYGWHQDGAFLGKNLRTLNLWIALTDCGVTAPSMDMVPARLEAIIPSGTEGAAFSWTVSEQHVLDNPSGEKPVLLHFRAGDIIFFDDMNLHRTATRPGMTETRKAIEAWFFASSCYPDEQVPLLV